MKKVFTTILIILCCCSVWAGKVVLTKIPLQPELTTALNQVLEAASNLQEAFYKQNDQEIETNLNRLLATLRQAKLKARAEKISGIHVGRILETASFHFTYTLRSTGDERKQKLKLAFEQVVLIAQTYKLDTYRIFFCGKNDGVWLQKSSKPQNPFSPQTYGDCGKLVR